MKYILHKIYISKWWILTYIIAILIRVAISFPLIHDWDGFVFISSAKNMLHGITPYKTVENNSPTIYPDSNVPMTQQWYAYPPLPLLMFTIPYAAYALSGIHNNPLFDNFVIKISFMLGDIVCAYLTMLFLKKWSKKLANRASLLLLFNPLLIWISSAWGMFDIWLINFILLFLLSLRSRKIILAGICLALAPQVKLFPVFFLPACIVFFFQIIQEKNKRILFITTFICITLLIDVPFFISSPQGFMNQNLLMDIARPPQGIGIVGMLDYLGFVYGFSIAHVVTIGSILMAVSILFFNLFSFGYIQGKESKLLTSILLIYTSILLFSKVVNEQYFILVICLLILLTHLPKNEQTLFGRKFLVRFEVLTTFSILLAAVVLGFHFLTFLPSFISDGMMKASTNYLVFYLSRLMPQLPLYTYPNSLWTYYNAPVTIIYILMIPLLFFLMYVVGRGAIEALRIRNDIFHSLKTTIKSLKPTPFISIIVVLFVVLVGVLIKPVSSYLKATHAFQLVDLVDPHYKPTFPKNPRVGTFYNVWWNNPSHDPDLADDAWSLTTLTPQAGYYTSKDSYFVQHIKQMKQAGIDFSVISYHLYDRQRYLTFGFYAEKLGLYYAPMIETDDALSDTNLHGEDSQGNKLLGFSVNEESKNALETYFLSAIAENYSSKALLKINKNPVVFVYDGQYFFPSWDSTSKETLAKRVIAMYKKKHEASPFTAITKSWGKSVTTEQDVLAQYPKSIIDFNGNTPSEKDYKQAFLEEYQVFWQTIKKDVEKKVGPIYIISTYASPLPDNRDFVIQSDTFSTLHVFDDEFYYSLSNTWAWWRLEALPTSIMDVWVSQEKNQVKRDRKNGQPVFLTVNPTYKDTVVRGQLGFDIPARVNQTSIYNWTWQEAITNKADFVLIATWNEFFEGSAIEPTKEYGDYYLKETKKWTQQFRAQTVRRGK